MTRPTASSKWYLPLFAGTEVVARSGALTQFPVSGILGTLPGQDPNLLPNTLLWFDSSRPSTLHRMPSLGIYRQDDISGANNHGTQGNPAQQPLRVTDTLTPYAVDFKD